MSEHVVHIVTTGLQRVNIFQIAIVSLTFLIGLSETYDKNAIILDLIFKLQFVKIYKNYSRDLLGTKVVPKQCARARKHGTDENCE
jgi:hypothetical protein